MEIIYWVTTAKSQYAYDCMHYNQTDYRTIKELEEAIANAISNEENGLIIIEKQKK